MFTGTPANACTTPRLESALAAVRNHWPAPEVGLGTTAGSGWMPARAWTSDDDAIDGLLAYQQSFTPDLDGKGQAAYAVGDYAQMVASAFAPLMAGFRIVPDFSPAGVDVGFDLRPLEHRGRTVMERLWRMRLRDAGYHTDDCALAGDPDAQFSDDLPDVFRRHVEAHMRPLVEALHRRSSLSRNALWRLVGDSLSQLFLDAGRRFGRLEQAKADALAILKATGSPLANRQMHYFDIEVRDQEDRLQGCVTFRARGGCCRYYTVEGGHLCATCVLQDPVLRDAKLEWDLRRRFGLASPS